MKKSLLFALCLGLATITAAAQRNYSQVDPIQPVPTAKQVAWQKRKRLRVYTLHNSKKQ